MSLPVCEVCTAVQWGNATCFNCVSHWDWMDCDQRVELVNVLKQRKPEPPTGADEIEDLIGRLAAAIK